MRDKHRGRQARTTETIRKEKGPREREKEKGFKETEKER